MATPTPAATSGRPTTTLTTIAAAASAARQGSSCPRSAASAAFLLASATTTRSTAAVAASAIDLRPADKRQETGEYYLLSPVACRLPVLSGRTRDTARRTAPTYRLRRRGGSSERY